MASAPFSWLELKACEWLATNAGVEWREPGEARLQSAWTSFAWWRFEWLDLAFTVACALVLTWLRYRVQRKAARYARRTLQLKKRDTRRKFSESLWKLLYYSTSCVAGLLVMWRAGRFEWLREPLSMWRPVASAAYAPMPLATRAFYLFELGFYLHSIVAHVWIEVRRKDFVEMLAHHVITLVLVGSSYTFETWRVGVLIVVLHDISDVLLERAKLYIYVGRDALANAWFGAWVASWVVLRLAFFPLYVLRSCIYDSARTLGMMRGYFLQNGALCALLVLHTIWFFMIVRVLVKMATGEMEKVEDTREQEMEEDLDFIESESSEGSAETKKKR